MQKRTLEKNLGASEKSWEEVSWIKRRSVTFLKAVARFKEAADQRF